MPISDLPHAPRPLTDAHRALIRLLAEAYVEELEGGSDEWLKETSANQEARR